MEKPLDSAEANTFIKSYGTAPCSTIGCIVLTDTATGKQVEGIDVSHIYLKLIPDQVINSLIEEGEIFYCAGGLMIEHPMVQPYIEKIDGTLDSVMGLRKSLVNELLSTLASI